LPDCIIIKDRVLQAKAGYIVTVSTDGKIFTVSNEKSVSGPFRCDCSGNNTGSCFAKVTGDTIGCIGLCDCKISVVVSGVTNTVDISAGLLRKN